MANLTMPVRPENPIEQAYYDDTYRRWNNIGMGLAALGPIPVLWPVWWPMRHAMGIEGAAGVAAILQIILVVWLPDRLAERVAGARLIRARRDRILPDWTPPPRN